MKMNVTEAYQDTQLNKLMQPGDPLDVSAERAAVLEEAGVAYREHPEVGRTVKPAETKPNSGPAEVK